ncbi:MAG: hypothetical protein AAGH53_06265 [Pseudomonadota bacterium]
MNFPHKRPSEWQRFDTDADGTRQLRRIGYAELIAMSNIGLSGVGRSDMGTSHVGRSGSRAHHSDIGQAEDAQRENRLWDGRIGLLTDDATQNVFRSEYPVGSFAGTETIPSEERRADYGDKAREKDG